ncbi:MAG: hypothetical protein HOQ03_14145 [Thermoleophilia bacterium]|nr:hypothetical protein [Thermoleophilia bacterium]
MGEPSDADVILDVVFDRGLLFLVLENLGDRPAHGVRVRFAERFSGVGGTKRIDRLALFRKLEFLAPRKAIEVFLDRSDAYFARGEPTGLTARVTWRTPGGARRAATIVHDLEIYRDLGYIEREVPTGGRPA